MRTTRIFFSLLYHASLTPRPPHLRARARARTHTHTHTHTHTYTSLRRYYATGYPAMGKALAATGRDIVYSCSWPAYLGDDEATKPYDTMIASNCNLWRNWHDIGCSWGSLTSIIDHYGDYGKVLQKVTSISRPARRVCDVVCSSWEGHLGCGLVRIESFADGGRRG
jgi:hypothetical protein